MKMCRIIKEEKGSALPFITLLMAFLLMGLAALIVDAGLAYDERRAMVTAADASALAGAKIVEEAFMNNTDMEEAKTEAEKVAIDLAIANGVQNIEDVQVSWTNPDYERDTITVSVKNNQKLIFARFFGFSDTDVAAKAVATWGYVTKLEGGRILPIFTREDDYQTGETTYLHVGSFVSDSGDVINGNWGLLDIFGSTSGIADAFSGRNMDERMELDIKLDNQTGLNAGNVNNPIEDRMIAANELPDKEDRQKYMCGLVPVIKWEAIDIQGATLKLPIKHFAIFEIYDVIVSEGNGHGQYSEGSSYALYDTENYTSDGEAIVYDRIDTDGDGDVEDMAKSTIIGQFVGEPVEVWAILDPDDQENPNPGEITATYSKLIE